MPDEHVVFHCAFSQQRCVPISDTRGPKAARIYQEVRSATQPANLHQQILVLRDGFGYFGPKFKQDAQLVEDWDEEAWKYR